MTIPQEDLINSTHGTLPEKEGALDGRLRIALVSVQDASDIRTFSGITFHVLEELRTQGVDVEVISPLRRTFRYVLAPAAILARIRKRGSSLEHYPFALRSYARQIGDHLRRRPVDIVFATSSIPIALLRPPLPVVFWTGSLYHQMHDYYGGAAFGNPTSSAQRRGRRQEEQALARATYAIYASRWAASAASQFTDPAKIRVLPWGAGVKVQHTGKEVLEWAKQKRAQRPSRCELLFIGIDWERKGGALAVETARWLNNHGIRTTLRVAGCRPAQPLPDFVEVIGHISKSTPEGRQRFEDLCRDADFFILPTRAEAAGIVFCEASAYGLPSITFDTGGVSDYVRHGVSGFCFPLGSGPEVFAKAILETLKDQTRYERLAANAFLEFETRLNWKTSVCGLIDILRQTKTQADR
jgi:glycosyltransferase involved in cell wall biosynthesis